MAHVSYNEDKSTHGTKPHEHEFKYSGCKAAEPKTVAKRYLKERKPEIYVHDLSRIPVHSIMKPTLVKPSSTVSNNSKYLLDQLEESYWATWKPQKESPHETKFRRRNKFATKNTAYGDVAEHLIKYFGNADFDTSSIAIQDLSEQEVFHKCDEGTSPELETQSQEIQTELFSEFKSDIIASAPKIANSEKHIKDHSTKKEKSNSRKGKAGKKHSSTKKEENKATDAHTGAVTHQLLESISDKPMESVPDKLLESVPDKSLEPILDKQLEPIPDKHLKPIPSLEPILEVESEPKILAHKDSLIIAKEKQGEVKEPFQQPKCIKLHKKTPSSLMPKIYQTKPCFRRESSQSSHFRLGAPGSTLFVTANSFNKKYMH